MKRALLIASALFALAACDDKKTETNSEDPSAKNATTTTSAAAPTAAPTTTEATPVTAPVAVTINDSDLSTPADFEESAEKSISKANYKAELATLEGDIAKD